MFETDEEEEEEEEVEAEEGELTRCEGVSVAVKMTPASLSNAHTP